jgi:two-component system chemotaxis sensor kinase CheA
MSDGMQQFHEHFLAESQEALSAIESLLLQLSAQGDNAELLAKVFRLAHSIKGGAAMCGFSQIAAYTHSLETLLDALRSHRINLSERASDTLLQSVDVLRQMLGSPQSQQPRDALRQDAVHAELVALVSLSDDESEQSKPAAPTVVVKPAAQAQQAWALNFECGPQLLRNGIDPLQLFNDLATLGSLQVQAQLQKLPSLRDLDTQVCQLSWDLVLTTAAPAEAIELVLEWAAGDCRYTLSPIANEPPVEKPSARVSVDKLDDILRLAGELVMQQAQVHRLAASWQGSVAEQLRDGLAQVDARIHELQDAVLRTRLSPVSTVFAPFNRLVRDLAGPLGKQIRVQNSGERTEMDKALLEKIADPLLHLVRNCVDHGIESPAERVAAGKSAEGEIRLYAAHRGGSVTIEVSDDGKGLNTQRILAKAIGLGLVPANANLSLEQITNLVFLPGFSTAAVTTELSGRGVGMDVVRRKVLELGGTIDISSHAGRGTCFTMSLPLSTSIVDGITVSCADELYIVPLTTLVDCVPLQQTKLVIAADQSTVLAYQGEHLPVLDLDALLFGMPSAAAHSTSLLVVVEDSGSRIALRVDAVLDRQPVVLKSMDNGYAHIDGVGATAVLATGSAVARILDVPALVRLSGAQQQRRRIA